MDETAIRQVVDGVVKDLKETLKLMFVEKKDFNQCQKDCITNRSKLNTKIIAIGFSLMVIGMVLGHKLSPYIAKIF